MEDYLISINEFFKDLGILGAVIGWGFGVITTFWATKSRINADLKAKTRLEWIKEVRNLTAQIIEEHNNYFKLVYTYSEKYKQATKGINSSTIINNIQNNVTDEFKIKSIELITSTTKNRNLYKLYFAKITKRKWYDLKRYWPGNRYKNSDENNKMHDLVEAVYDQINSLEEYFLAHGDIDPKIKKSDAINNFRNETSNYLKREWDNAKNNK